MAHHLVTTIHVDRRCNTKSSTINMLCRSSAGHSSLCGCGAPAAVLRASQPSRPSRHAQQAWATLHPPTVRQTATLTGSIIAYVHRHDAAKVQGCCYRGRPVRGIRCPRMLARRRMAEHARTVATKPKRCFIRCLPLHVAWAALRRHLRHLPLQSSWLWQQLWRQRQVTASAHGAPSQHRQSCRLPSGPIALWHLICWGWLQRAL